jgi:hypothetical protein
MRELVQNTLDHCKELYMVDVHQSQQFRNGRLTVYSFLSPDTNECVGTVQIDESTEGLRISVTKEWDSELPPTTLHLAQMERKNMAAQQEVLARALRCVMP